MKTTQAEHAARRARILALDDDGIGAAEIARREGVSYMAVWSALRRAGRRPLAAPSEARDLEWVEIKPILDRVRGPFGLALSLAQLHAEIARWAKANGMRPIALPTLKNWSAGKPCRPGGPVRTFLAFARAKGVL